MSLRSKWFLYCLRKGEWDAARINLKGMHPIRQRELKNAMKDARRFWLLEVEKAGLKVSAGKMGAGWYNWNKDFDPYNFSGFKLSDGQEFLVDEPL